VSARFRRGLVVGKFSPLHRGHELVIQDALAACDEVIVLSYSRPEFPGCDAETRAGWLAALFPAARRLVLADDVPANDAPDDDHRRFVARVCHERLGDSVDAVFTSEDYGEGFARFLTAYFQRADPRAPPVAHVLVDRERQRLPVSGTLVRGDVHAHRAWLSPVVYASFVERVCILGGESSGKSTLAAALAAAHGTAWVAEYGRTLWEQKAGALVLPDMVQIGERQVALEAEGARTANRWLFCDTSPLTTLFYSREMFGEVDPALEALARRRYPFTIVCAPDFPFVQDGTRREPAFRDRQHAWYLRELEGTGARFAVVSGGVEARVAQVRGLLASGPPAAL
jgi:HTH-type transcriptional repressor of NAD biosynthesis genes